MAKMNGCNDGMVAPNGKMSTRVNPADSARNSMSKGGVNDHAHGSDKFSNKPKLAAGKNGTGKFRQDGK